MNITIIHSTGPGYCVDPGITPHLISVLVKRLGGKVIIKQEDLDAVAYTRLEESMRTPEEGLVLEVLEEEPK